MNFGYLDGSDLEFPNRKSLIKTLNRREETFSKFKSLWFESYLLSLRESSRDTYENNWDDRVKVGDIVLIHSPFKSRIHWPIGRVIELLTGSDTKTRCVKVQRSDSSVEVYSISHLYPLELSLLTTKKDKIIIRRKQTPRKAALRCREANKCINKSFYVPCV